MFVVKIAYKNIRELYDYATLDFQSLGYFVFHF